MKHAMSYMLRAAVLSLLAMAMTFCHRRPLVELSNTHYIRVYIDEQIKNVTTGFYDETLDKPDYESPEMLRVVLYEPNATCVTAGPTNAATITTGM